ncbi:MAG TPA: hypothetical protein VKG01_20505 [Thermoanaerobaculia bacterium]|nr:hypothetical protein [Thermoanaerobaculia bacterium]
MKRTQAATFESASARISAAARRERSETRGLAWALLAAEIGAVFALFSSGLVPATVVRALQVFLRF